MSDPDFGGVGLAPARKYRAIQAPAPDAETLLEVANEIKEVVETLVRLRGDVRDSVVTVDDLDRIWLAMMAKINDLDTRLTAAGL